MTRPLCTLLLMALAACAGREPVPVQISQTGDGDRTCAQLESEIAANQGLIAARLEEEERIKGKNVAVGVVGAILFWPALFAIDLKDAAGTERAMLQARQQHLAGLAGRRCADEAAAKAKADADRARALAADPD